MPALLEVVGITKRFGGVLANDGVSFALQEGEILGLIGPNGAGKSTLFGVISGYLRPEAGEVRLRGQPITGLPPETIARLGVARTFQLVRPFGALTVLENVMVGSFLRHGSTAAARRRAQEVLEFTGLAQRAGQLAASLTIADKKRLELARALATEPQVLLLDEIMSGLTPAETQQAVELLRRVRERGVTLLLVEHVMEVVMPLSDRVVVLDSGRKIAEGPPREIVNHPQVVRSYLGEPLGGEPASGLAGGPATAGLRGAGKP